MATFYSIADVLSVARIHPFYNPSCKYPPSPQAIAHALKSNNGDTSSPRLSEQPLLHKDQLYTTIERLCADESVENGYRLNSYISTTGGGSGRSLPMLFLTDAEENQNQRVAMSQLMKACKMFEPSDWVLNLHTSGFLYRALDLTTQCIEQAGGSVLCAGHLMPHEKLLAACIKYRVNVISGDGPQILNFAHDVAALPSSARCNLRITKINFTCEVMSRSKREYLMSVFGPVAFSSMFASAETGPWAVAVDNITGKPDDENTVDLLFDTRAMNVEVLSLSSETKSESPPGELQMVPEGSAGQLVLTSLQRLRNPLVRYISGDLGSIRPLPEVADSQIDLDLRRHWKVLRMYGRDQRFSFKWLGEYFELGQLNSTMQTEEWGILQWQIIVEHSKEYEGSDFLEVRMLRRSGVDEKTISNEELLRGLVEAFFLTPLNENLLRAIFLDDLQGFERSETSGKVIRFIDKRG